MTFVLTCLTSDYVVLVADRRLVAAGRSPAEPVVVDDDACKVVLLREQFAFGYSGLAEMEQPPAGRTDLWLVNTLQRISEAVGSIPMLFDRFAIQTVEAFQHITDIDVSKEPHTFVAVGFQGGPDDLSPVFISLSNARDLEGRRRQPSLEWVLRSETLGDSPVGLHQTGAQLDMQARDELEMVLPEIAHDNPAGVVDYLGQAIRAESRGGNPAVGESLLAVLLPKKGVASGAGISMISLEALSRTAVEDLRGPVVLDSPFGERDWTMSAPHIVQPTFSVAGTHVWNRALGPQEIKARYEGARKRLPSAARIGSPPAATSQGRYMGESEHVENTGRHFDGDAYAQLPVRTQARDWTLEGWFVWSSGPGPLICSDEEDWSWGWLYDRGGLCAYRIGGVERQISVTLASARDRRMFVAVAKAANEVILWLNDRIVDRWDAVPPLATLSNALVMKHATGFAEHIALYDVRVPDDRLALRWDRGKAGIPSS
jgi:hypothetical protein